MGMHEKFGDINLVMKCIRKVQQVDDSKEMWILFGHDELQQFFNPDELESLKNGNLVSLKNTKIYKYITESMNIGLSLAKKEDQRNFLISTFTGTFPLHFTNILAGTHFQFENITLKALKPEQGFELILKKKRDKPDYFNNLPFKRLVELCGNIPRIWRVLDQSIDEDDFDPVEFLEKLETKVKKEYNLSSTLGQYFEEAFVCHDLAMDFG
jgi:hypothetical protein